MIPQLEAGDIGLSASKEWLSSAIRWFERLQTGEANRSHAFSMISGRRCVEALVRVRVSDFKKYEEADIEVYRLPLSDNEREDFADGIMLSAGDDYGWFKIPLHAADSILSMIRKKPTFYFTKKFGITSFKDCSQLAVWALHNFTDYVLQDENHEKVEWRTVSPDYLQDLFCLPHNNAERIYKWSPQ